MQNKFAIYLAAVGHLVTDMAQGALPALLPLLIKNYGLSYQEAGGLIFANTALASVTQPLFGYLADKRSMPWLIPLGMLLSGCCIAAMGFVHSYQNLFIFAMIAGIGSALFHPEGARLVNRMSGKQKGKAMGIFAVGGNAGFAIGPMLAGLAYIFNEHTLSLFALTNSLIALILFLQLPKLTGVKHSNNKKVNLAAELKNDWQSFSKLSVIIFVRATNFTVLNAFIPIYWISVLHQKETDANLALTLFLSVGVLITFLGGLLSDRLGYVRVIRYAYVIFLPTIFIFTQSETLWLSLLLLIPLGLGVFTQYSPIVVLGQTYLAKSVGFAAGITLGLGITMGGVFSPIVGWLADHYGIQLALQTLCVLSLFGLAFSYWLKSGQEKNNNGAPAGKSSEISTALQAKSNIKCDEKTD
ncbi:MFS transporter [Necropsobacter massiliensis]|uniref:MFS transporter n=1 Tax=Necropsobacter massiliensis TaxID=1400001 RepID=UPI0009E18E91|nr:MFS transporter [Necropsobacter massiliensis]